MTNNGARGALNDKTWVQQNHHQLIFFGCFCPPLWQSWETALDAPHSTRVQTSGEYLVGHASPTIFSCSGFYLAVAPIYACYVAAPPEAI